MSRAERLGTFLQRFDGEPVIWGVSDCSAAPATWLQEETGIALHLAAYSSEAEARALIAAAGGLDRLWEDALGNAGVYPRIGEPELGDVGLVTMRDTLRGCIFADGGICAIRNEKTASWFWMTPRPRFVRAWALPG